MSIRELTTSGEAGESLVVHFQTGGNSINAYTLASALVGIADAAKAANASLNVGYDIDVVVEALSPGSFRATLRALYKTAGNLFSRQDVRAIILAIIASFVYDHTLAVDHTQKIEINTDEAIVENGHDKVIIPRNIYDAMKRAEENSAFTNAMDKSFQAVARDERITGMGFVARLDAGPPPLVISSETLRRLESTERVDPDTRVLEEQADLFILKAILDRSTRKWEFIWRGEKVSAPVTDGEFFDKFFAHRITIAPGDMLRVILFIKQVRNRDTGIYTNAEYTVSRVLEHVPRMQQQHLADTSH